MIDIQFGFQSREYIFYEPYVGRHISNIVIIKRNNRRTEQTLTVNASINNTCSKGINTATQGEDYMLLSGSSNTLQFKVFPNQQNITIDFFINADDLIEGTEFFRVNISVIDSCMTFNLHRRSNYWESTEIFIYDTDSKLFAVSWLALL